MIGGELYLTVLDALQFFFEKSTPLLDRDAQIDSLPSHLMSISFSTLTE